MADPKTTEEKPTEAAPEAPDERKVPESALKKQASDFNAEREAMRKENAELMAFRQKFESDQKKAEDARMLANNEHSKIIEEREIQISELQGNIQNLERSHVANAARDALRDLGMSDALRLTGALAGLPSDATTESVTEWATAIKAANAAAFEALANPTPQQRAGTPSAGGGSADDLNKRLASPDLTVRSAAIMERRQLREFGKL